MPQEMTAAHKDALARGRAEGRAVRTYLDALARHRPRRGRPRTPDSIKKRLAAIEDEGRGASTLRQLQLLQERRDLEAELDARSKPGADLARLETEFVKVARSYAQRKGIAYATWREMGVPADVLRKAGIGRGGA
jgi:hypothetical protein